MKERCDIITSSSLAIYSSTEKRGVCRTDPLPKNGGVGAARALTRGLDEKGQIESDRAACGFRFGTLPVHRFSSRRAKVDRSSGVNPADFRTPDATPLAS